MNSPQILAQALSDFGIPHLDIPSILLEAGKNGAVLTELFFEETLSTRIIYEGGRLDRVMDGTDRGVGLRVIFDSRSVYGYTTDLSQESILRLASDLSVAVAQSAGGLASLSMDSVEWRESRQPENSIAQYRIQNNPKDLPLKERIQIAKRIDQGARKEFPEARQITAVLLDTSRRTLVLNSDGLVAPVQKYYFQMVCQVVGSQENRVESAMASEGGFVGLEFLKQTPPEQVGAEAAQRARVLLSAKPAPAGTMPVVLAAEAGGTMIHEAVGHGLEADLACNGLSVYEGKIGQQVASPLITVVDDGTILEKRGSFALDDEGTPSKKNVLIENGILKGYMVDRISAMKFDLMATGNGRRETFRSIPIVRMTNTYIAPGKDDPQKILADTDWGIYVKAMGGGQVNTVTGDFVFAVTEGYLIRQGKIAEPIRGATLVGNGPKVISIVDRVGTDLGYATGTCGKDGQGAPVTDAQPTMRIPELTVGGEVPIQDYWSEKQGA